MKSIRLIQILITLSLALLAVASSAQKGVEKHPKGKVVVVNKKRHHSFRRGVVYHPVWAPKSVYRHRWVFFPRYNFYWDNLHNVYVVETGSIWVVTEKRPNEIEGIDLLKEKSVELGEESDSVDTIQEMNLDHQKQYKVE
jgi:hypothetical protein